MTRIFKLLLLTVTLLSCNAKKTLLKKNYEINKIAINGDIKEFEIIDHRKDTTSRKLKIPTISFPGQSDATNPSLTQAQKDSIVQQINSYFLSGNEEFKIKIEVLKGIKEFSAHTFNEREFVQFDAKITLSNMNNNEEKNCSSTAFFESKSMDASNKFIDKIYLKAIRTSIYKCFEKITE